LSLLAFVAGACTESSSSVEGDGSGCDRGDGEHAITVALPGDPPLELRVESCRRDVDYCPRLCRFVVERAGIDTFPDHCAVTLATNTLTVAYAHTYWQCP
jgi:hypothetical protein